MNTMDFLQIYLNTHLTRVPKSEWEEFLKENRNSLTSQTDPLPCLYLADGNSISIQASKSHYSSPRADAGIFTEVEIGYPSWDIEGEVEDLYMDSGNVGGYADIVKVAELIDFHGGVVDTDYTRFLRTVRFLEGHVVVYRQHGLSRTALGYLPNKMKEWVSPELDVVPAHEEAQKFEASAYEFYRELVKLGQFDEESYAKMEAQAQEAMKVNRTTPLFWFAYYDMDNTNLEAKYMVIEAPTQAAADAIFEKQTGFGANDTEDGFDMFGQSMYESVLQFANKNGRKATLEAVFVDWDKDNIVF